MYVAVDTGIFARNGVDVSLAQVAGPAQVAALGTGELQVGILGGNEIVNADVNGADVVAVATVSDFPIFSLYVQPKYASVEELAGQSIGVTSSGSTTDAVAHLFMQHYNMLDKVTIMAAGGSIPGVLAAVQQGTVAGGILSPPATAQAAAAGLRELINGVTLGVPLNHDSIAMTRKFIADNPDAVMRFLRAYAQAWTFCADPANEAAAVAAVQKYTGSSAADAKVGYDALKTVYTSKAVPTVDLEGMKNIMSLADNPRVKSADPAQFVDNSFIEKVKP